MQGVARAGAIAALAVWAQVSVVQAEPRTGPEPGIRRAVALEAKARELLGNRSQWRSAASMLERAAGLREVADPVAVADLVLAGSAWYYAGERGRARDVLARGGERALADGDIAVAARTFLTAAVIATELGDPSAGALRARAERLAHSPLLSEQERQLILNQFRATSQDGA